MISLPRIKAHFVVCCIALVSFSSTSWGQVLNGEFNNQTQGDLHWWYGHGGCTVARTAAESSNGTYSALVSNRTVYWNGLGQELNGDLTIGKDYHFQCRVRTKDVPSALLRIEIAQDDDRGSRFFDIARVEANDAQWTLLEGGFHLLVNGDLNDLRFIISGDFDDDRLFDFYVDSVTITENDWRSEADDRIEQFRKRDVVLNLSDEDGGVVGDVAIDIQQIGHQFAFGSTLNDAFIQNAVYADFFKENFNWATIEWFSQWKPVEVVRGVSDYSNADATVEFARANGITLRGHALAWPDTRFVPTWLQGLSPEEHRAEISKRIDSVVSRYAGKLVHWDVNNEMLNFTYFLDNAGSDIREAMFQQARQIDPDVKLFTNEFGLTESGAKSSRYRELVQGLQAAGADIGGIGLQSHFDSNVSPKALELALAKLTDLGPEIWFTEFDVSNPNAVERAKLLETFYRYAFSVPEAEGIIMWGFWPGTHWRGADASIVDLDWTVNAAGQKYFDLIDEWTTRETTSVSGGATEANFRGFHGNYLITTVQNGITQYHIVSVEKSGAGAGQAINLTVSDDPVSNGLVMVYGSSADDVFKYDFANPSAIEINGVVSSVPVLDPTPRFSVVGGAGNDRLEILAAPHAERFLMKPTSLLAIGGPNRIVFRAVEDVECIAGNSEDQIIMAPTRGKNEFVSDPLATQWFLGNREISATGFKDVVCGSSSEDDVAVILGDALREDVISSDFKSYVRAVGPDSRRQFLDFPTTKFVSQGGSDMLVGGLSDQPTSITAAMNDSRFVANGRVYEFTGVGESRISVGANAAHTAVIDVSEDPAADTIIFRNENISIRRGAAIGFSLTGVRNLETVSGANDRVIVVDSSGNDAIEADSDRILLQIGSYTVTSTGEGATAAVSSGGGEDTATLEGRPVRLTLIGGWVTQ